jgi:hypothetical protein
MKLSNICLLAVLISTNLSCHVNAKMGEAKPISEPSITKQIDKKINRPAFPVDAPIEEQMEYKLRYPLYRYENAKEEEFDKDLLKEKSKFRKMATACFPERFTASDTRIPIFGEFAKPLQLEPNLYLLFLICGRGRGASRYSWFIYRPQTGIQADGIKFRNILVDASGSISTNEESFISVRGFDYNQAKKEITITVPCHRGDGLIASRKVYRYENAQIALVEYWQDSASNSKCTQKPQLKQYYP